MKPAFWLCLLLVVASGLSAYIGNEWGRKLGKRKLSIFSMRPKHSSTFLTVLLSMCLSLGLMGILFVFSPQLQQQLFLPNPNSGPTLAAYELALASANKRIEQLSQQAPVQQAPVQLTLESSVQKVKPVLLASSRSKPAKPAIKRPVLTRNTSPAVSSPAVSSPAVFQGATQSKKNRISKPVRTKDPAPVLTQEPSKAATSKNRFEEPVQIAVRVSSRSTASRVQARRFNKAEVADTLVAEENKKATSPNYPTGSLFQLTLNGNLNPSESRQVSQGIQSLTQDYLRLLGVQATALNWKSARLQSEVLKLSSTGQYRLNVQLQSAVDQKIPVAFQVTRLADALPEAEFDPQLLLEEQRLQSSGSGDSIQQDLQAVLKQHASQQQIALQLAPVRSTPVRNAQLPFDIINLKSIGNVLTGELLLKTP